MKWFLLTCQGLIAGGTSALILSSLALITPSYAQEGDFCNALLSEHPGGGAGLRDEVQNLVAAAPGVAQEIVGCANKANDAQVKALGVGLAKVVVDLKETNPQQADDIATIIAGSKNKTLKTAYAGDTSDAEEATAVIDGSNDDGSEGEGVVSPDEAPVRSSRRFVEPVLTVGAGSGTGGGTVSPN